MCHVSSEAYCDHKKLCCSCRNLEYNDVVEVLHVSPDFITVVLDIAQDAKNSIYLLVILHVPNRIINELEFASVLLHFLVR